MKRHLAAVAFLLSALGTRPIRAQSTTPSQSHASASFEVAAIKPADPSDPGTMIRFDSGRLQATGVTLKLLIRVAYGVHDFQIVGLPPLADSYRFNVDAKAADAKTANTPAGNPSIMTDDEPKAVEAKLHLRSQNLLGDRFNLKAQRETREMPVYALVIAKGGSKLNPATDRRGLMGRPGRLRGTGATLDMLARLLSNATDRNVIDRPGLNGAFDFKLEWTPDPGEMGLTGGTEASTPTDGPSLFTAIQEHSGSGWKPQRGPSKWLSSIMLRSLPGIDPALGRAVALGIVVAASSIVRDSFEVASIRLNLSGESDSCSSTQNGRFIGGNQDLRDLIEHACER